MSTFFFQFGERLPGHPVPMLNERAVRAGAGLLFLFAMQAFMNAWLTGNFGPTRVFVVAFLLDFGVRLVLSPRWAPSLIVGQWLVRHQQPEWTGAAQKRFAWSIGMALALAMFWLAVVRQVMGPLNLLVCSVCMTLLFFETAFGICLGCKLYAALARKPPQACPGQACERTPDPRVQPSVAQGLAVLLYVALLLGLVRGLPLALEAPQEAAAAHTVPSNATGPVDPADVERCRVPEFAKAMGHEDLWKRHNHCP